MLKSPVLKTQVLDNTLSVISQRRWLNRYLDILRGYAKRLVCGGFHLSVRPVPHRCTLYPADFFSRWTDQPFTSSSADKFGANWGATVGHRIFLLGTAPTDLAEQWLDILDMQDEKWTDELVRRIDREFRTGGKDLNLR